MPRPLIMSALALAALSGVALAQTTSQGSSGTQAPNTSSPSAGSGTTAPAPSRGSNQTTQSGGPAVPQGMQAIVTATVPVTFMTVQPADVMSSNLIGTNVYNNNNESIGEIEDLVIDNGRTIRSVIIGVGGFLGLGERYVAVEPGAVTLLRQSDGGGMRAVINTTSEQLKNAPAFSYSKKKR